MIASIPLIGFIYGPVSGIPEAVMVLKWVLFPLIVLSGLWLWKGQSIKKWAKRKMTSERPYPFLIN
jgi:hypothetical protein